MTELTLERLAELEMLEKAAGPAPWRAGRSDTTSYTGNGVGPYKNVYGPRNEPELHLGHEIPLEEAQGWGEQCIENAQLIAAMRNELPALLAAARRLLELKRKALRVTHRDVTLDEIERVTSLAIDARNALLTPGGSSAPIVRWLMWQEDRGLAVALELLQRDERLRELEGALEFLNAKNFDGHGWHPDRIVDLARRVGWPGIESGKGGADV